jgi:ligand-binding SRPBCC domain-containing protein
MMSKLCRLERTQNIAGPRRDVFAFFADASNLEMITPGSLRFRILTSKPMAMPEGAHIDYGLSLHGLPFTWRTRITRWEPERCFVDERESGPYALWRHTYRFEDLGDHTTMHDLTEHAFPWGLLGTPAHALVVQRTLARIFDFRRDAIRKRFSAAAVRGAA